MTRRCRRCGLDLERAGQAGRVVRFECYCDVCGERAAADVRWEEQRAAARRADEATARAQRLRDRYDAEDRGTWAERRARAIESLGSWDSRRPEVFGLVGPWR